MSVQPPSSNYSEHYNDLSMEMDRTPSSDSLLSETNNESSMEELSMEEMPMIMDGPPDPYRHYRLLRIVVLIAAFTVIGVPGYYIIKEGQAKERQANSFHAESSVTRPSGLVECSEGLNWWQGGVVAVGIVISVVVFGFTAMIFFSWCWDTWNGIKDGGELKLPQTPSSDSLLSENCNELSMDREPTPSNRSGLVDTGVFVVFVANMFFSAYFVANQQETSPLNPELSVKGPSEVVKFCNRFNWWQGGFFAVGMNVIVFLSVTVVRVFYLWCSPAFKATRATHTFQQGDRVLKKVSV